ncbi:hypothetical protein M3P05_12545 [Sansalvadorimonas sp. 2012CJ34-2]|uniref:Uncharacterized protein n=1 Tax=Parendozoicomonas callyspongiae TaxID=2942213 RepID=A0ABT0PHA5_9GAMM|nr:hypothetical protein [Sansalvadorimonas sp. 2012CJ34-2]MCL6270753.1 hypothetical protein [Sansalvadorimonas sp. 2012CJ34-2]
MKKVITVCLLLLACSTQAAQKWVGPFTIKTVAEYYYEQGRVSIIRITVSESTANIWPGIQCLPTSQDHSFGDWSASHSEGWMARRFSFVNLAKALDSKVMLNVSSTCGSIVGFQLWGELLCGDLSDEECVAATNRLGG